MRTDRIFANTYSLQKMCVNCGLPYKSQIKRYEIKQIIVYQQYLNMIITYLLCCD